MPRTFSVPLKSAPHSVTFFSRCFPAWMKKKQIWIGCSAFLPPKVQTLEKRCSALPNFLRPHTAGKVQQVMQCQPFFFIYRSVLQCQLWNRYIYCPKKTFKQVYASLVMEGRRIIPNQTGLGRHETNQEIGGAVTEKALTTFTDSEQTALPTIGLPCQPINRCVTNSIIGVLLTPSND